MRKCIIYSKGLVHILLFKYKLNYMNRTCETSEILGAAQLDYDTPFNLTLLLGHPVFV